MNNVAADIMAEVDRQKAQIAAEKRVLEMRRRLEPPKRYSVRNLALMTIGRGAFIAANAAR